MSRIKVLHITQSVGGVETYLKQVLSTIDHEKFEIVIVGTISEYLEPYCTKYNVRFKRLKMARGLNPFLDIISIFQLIGIIRKEKPVLTHLHSSKGGFLGRIATKWAGYKSLFTPHALSYLSFTGFKRMMFFFLELIGKKFTYRILAVSFTESNKLVYELGHKRENIFVIPNSLIITDKIDMRDKGLYKLDTKIKIGTIARLTPQKNPLLFVDIANGVIKKLGNDAHFYFLGVGEHDHLKDEVETKIKEYNIGDNIHLLQRGDLNTSISFLQQIDIFLFPSVFEGLSYALLEAMLESVPCVVSNVDGNNDMIQNNVNGYACILPEEYINSICELVNDKQKAKQMGDACRDLVVREHDLQKNIRKLENVYEKFAAKTE
jgi:glycosyltransferase involved in cell wall biosynthesis